MPNPVRNRIRDNPRVRGGDLVPHEWNFRLHPELQKLAPVPSFGRSLCSS